jgi:hypothetical protein
VSAYVPGLPVYAAAETHVKAERAICAVLSEYLKEHRANRPQARVRVARVSDRGKTGVRVVGVAALVGAQRHESAGLACQRLSRGPSSQARDHTRDSDEVVNGAK